MKNLLVLLAARCVAHNYDERTHFRDGALIWPYGTVSHLSDVNQHYLVYACQQNHTCPRGRHCVFDNAMDFSFSKRSNCSCDAVQHDRTHFLPGVIRQKHGCEVCLHKALWPPDDQDLFGGGMLLAGAVLSGAVGIGGGGLAVPILVLAMNFHVKEAVPLSHVAVFGSALAQNLVNLPRRHPLTHARPLVDAEVALLLMPCALLGHSLGVLVGPRLPEGVIIAIASFVLLFAAVATVRKAVHAYRAEVEAELADDRKHADAESVTAHAHANGSGARSAEPPQPPATLRGFLNRLLPAAASRTHELLPRDAVRSDAAAAGGANGAAHGQHVVLLEYPQPIDGGRVLLLLLTWLLFAAQYRLDKTDWRASYTGVQLARCTSHGFAEWYDCGLRLLPYLGLRTALYTALYGGVLAVVIASLLMTRQTQKQREEYGVPVLKGDIVWSVEQTLRTQALAVLVGLIAGLLGLGGGELMAPLLVQLGMLPEVVSAVNAFIIFFTAAADLEHYSDLGVLQLYADTITRPGYVVLTLVVGFFGALLGRVTATNFVRRLKHPSLLLFLLGGTLLLSAGLLIGRTVRREVEEVRIRSHDLICAY